MPPEVASSTLFTLDDLDAAEQVVRRVLPPTPQQVWPMLSEAVGARVWVKHENHTAVGAFKVRGGLVLLERLARRADPPAGVATATRGNHGQSLAFAGRAVGMPVLVVVPHGNNPEKNDAMTAWGAELVVHGRDFDEAREHAADLAVARGYELVAPFHPDLVLGVATYARELLSAVPDLATVYVPVGMGSGIAGLVTVRDLLGHPAEIVGVVADSAPSYALSFEAGTVIPTDEARTFVDGVACRQPDPLAVEIICAGAREVLRVRDEQTAAAMRMMLRCTHNLVEPAGAIALAGLLCERDRAAGRSVAVVLTGANVDAATLSAVLAGQVAGNSG